MDALFWVAGLLGEQDYGRVGRAKASRVKPMDCSGEICARDQVRFGWCEARLPLPLGLWSVSTIERA